MAEARKIYVAPAIDDVPDSGVAYGGDKQRNLKLRDALSKYDKNHDGKLNVDEIEGIVTDLVQDQKYIVFLKHLISGLFVMLIILLVSQTLLTNWLMEVNKETEVDSSSNTLVTVGGDSAVITEKPRYYIGVTDVPSLPTSALNSLNELSFTTTDGSLHNYVVAGKLIWTLFVVRIVVHSWGIVLCNFCRYTCGHYCATCRPLL